ncbi:MAG: zinc ribbon domain-containing protein [Candidatus Zixiibacteriota bacterium]|nr:MAG: zinc ribbon domain-containing protein [candidate division Zixibacteria bacterium]
MPTYEYQCDSCGYEFEEFQSISDPPVTICPECKGRTKRVISGGAGLIFKGSGFYITDYRNSQYKKDASKDSSAIGKPSEKKSSSDSATSSKAANKD